MVCFSKEFNSKLVTFGREDFFRFFAGSAVGSKMDGWGRGRGVVVSGRLSYII